jgi:uncharacterized OsmC-like protein
MSDHNSSSGSGIETCGCRAEPAPAGDAKFLAPDVVNVHWMGSKRFRVENSHGKGSLILEEGTKECSPCDGFMGALGGCANLAVLGQLQKRGNVPRSLQTQVSGTRTVGLPSAYERIHVTFSLATDLDDATVTALIGQVMTVLCPVAVTLQLAAEVTWEFRRVNAE